MKILIVSHYYAPHGGGIELVIQRLLQSMRLVAPEVHFTWAATDCDTPTHLAGVVFLPMRGSNIIERKKGVPQPLWYPSSLRALWRAVHTHDILWLHDTLYIGNICAYIMAKLARKPIFITQHIGQVPFSSALLRTLMRVGTKIFSCPMLRFANQSIFIAAHVQDYFKQQIKSWCAEPLFIPNGVQHDVYKPVNQHRREQLRQKFGLDIKPSMLFVGRFVEKKGMPILYRLTELLPDYDWIFAGKGSDDPASWQRFNCMTLRDRQGAGIAELYQAADLLVLPSRGEGLPLVIQEAAACGLPVLCGTETAAADPKCASLLFTEEVDGTNPDKTAALWKEKITAVLGNKTQLEERGKVLHDYATQHWCWTQAAQAYVGLFNSIKS